MAQVVKNLPAMQRPGLDPWVGKIPWRKEWQATPVFLPGESHGQRNLAGYIAWGGRVRHNWTTDTFTFFFSNTENVWVLWAVLANQLNPRKGSLESLIYSWSWSVRSPGDNLNLQLVSEGEGWQSCRTESLTWGSDMPPGRQSELG